jgi:hypothetical protein
MAGATSMLLNGMERATRNMKRIQLVFCVVLACAGAGCSKQEATPAPPPPPLTITKAAPPPPSSTVDVVPTPPPEAFAPTSPPVADEETQAQLAAEVKQLESDYQNTTDFQKHVVIIYSLSSNESTDTIDAVSRLFLGEKDQELRIEMINSLTDIQDQNDKKLAILSSALQADQPKEVRLAAVDGMGDVQDNRAIQVLQGFVNDPDEDVRDAAHDTIEQLQTAVAQPPPAGQPQPIGQQPQPVGQSQPPGQ